MIGPVGILKGYHGSQAVRVKANSTRLDDEMAGSRVCMLKADVEGYEPQVLLTAATAGR